MIGMNALKRFLYRTAILPFRLYRSVFVDLHVYGAHHIPPGPKIYAANHITSMDAYWAATVFPEPTHTIIGPGYEIRPVAWFLDFFEQINAVSEHRQSVVDQAVGYLEQGEAVATAPEGDLYPTFELGRFYPGVAQIYRRSRAPIIPMGLLAPRSTMRRMPLLDHRVGDRVFKAVCFFRGPFFIHFGAPFTPEIREDVDEKRENRRITRELRERIYELVEDVRVNKFWLEGGPGADGR